MVGIVGFNNTGVELGSHSGHSGTTIAQLDEASNPAGDLPAEKGHSPAVAQKDDFADKDSDFSTIEDLMPELLPVAGVLGLLLTAIIAGLVIGAVYAARSILHG
jgi:hypothetical protein